MARLPVPGSDENSWGDILNDFLMQAHTASGALKADSVGPSQLQTGAVTPADIGAVAIAGSNIATLANSSLQYLRVNIPDDGSSTGSWPDRLVFFFNGQRTGYHNEYGELRARPAKANTVALRAMGATGGSSGDIFQVTAVNNTTVRFAVSETAVTANVPLTAPNLPRNITVGPTAPSSPQDGDIWFDTSGA